MARAPNRLCSSSACRLGRTPLGLLLLASVLLATEAARANPVNAQAGRADQADQQDAQAQLPGTDRPAQPTDAEDVSRDASARMLFEQGVVLAESGDWAGAEDRYRRAFALRASPVIAYNLASALSELGKLIEASEVVRRVLSDDTLEPGLRRAATLLRDSVAARLCRIEIEVDGQQLGDSVVLDGRVLHAAQLSVEIPAEPGDHQLRLERAGQTLDLQTFALEPGGRAQLRLTAPPLAPTSEVALVAVDRPASGVPTRPRRPAEPGSLLTRWWFWTGAVVVVALGAAVGVAAINGKQASEPAFQGNLGPGSVELEVTP